MSKLVKIFPKNEELRQALDDYRTRLGLTVSKLADQLDSNVTQVSRYLGGRCFWNPEKLEAKVADLLKGESQRLKFAVNLHENSVTRAMASGLETIRKTNDIGVLFSRAGIGKTSGAQLYCINNPTALMVTATEWRRNPRGLEAMLFKQVNSHGWDRSMIKGDFLADKLRDSNRVLIIDNFHRLTKGGFQWVFDFQDDTNIPIALVGNPEGLKKLAGNDQMFSRIGLKKEIRPGNDLAASAKKVMETYCPDVDQESEQLADVIAHKLGGLRAVKKQSILARTIKDNSGLPRAKSLHAAHTQLIREYLLPELG